MTTTTATADRVFDIVRSAAQATPDRVGWICGDRSVTFAEMDRRTDAIATALLDLGVSKGDRIGLNALTQMAWLEVYFAAAKIGAVTVGLNVRYRSSELTHILNQSGTEIVITIPTAPDCDFIELLNDIDVDLRHVISIGPGGATTLDDLASTEPDTERVQAASDIIDSDDTVMVIYTSGTTGAPKGAQLTHTSQLAAASFQRDHCQISGDDTTIVALPLNHVGGLVCSMLATLVAGGRSVLIEAFSKDAIIEAISTHRPTIWPGVPTMHTVLLMDERIATIDTDQLRLVITGGSNAEPELLRRIQATFPAATVMNLYGLSETSGAAVMSPWDADFETVTQSIGRPIGDVQLRIANPTDPSGGPVAAGEIGEIQIAGPSVITGYLDLLDITDESFIDGWLRTGDMAEQSESGDVVLRGRAKEMFIQGGYNVYPAEVENVLGAHPAIAMCAGIGVPDPVHGEIGRYFVVTTDGAAVTDDELKAHCRGQLADYKVPRQIVFRDELPLTPTGKVQKAALRDD